MQCLLIQPIHEAGVELLRAAGLEVRMASAPDMDTVAREIGAAQAVITRNAGLSRAAIHAGSQLRIIGVHGTGYDAVDVEHATAMGVPVANTPYANVQSVAEQAISQMMAVAKRVCEADRAVRDARFDYRYANDFHELSGRTLGVVGFGRIGRRTAEIARAAFGMRVLVHSPSVPAQEVSAAGMEYIETLDTLLEQADIVSLHQRLTPATRGQFDAARLARMKAGAILVNTARGALIEARALIEALQSGHLMGAALDVFEPEPLPADHPYLRCERLVLSPHIGGATREAMRRTAIEVARQVVQALHGERPEWLVNPQSWDRRH